MCSWVVGNIEVISKKSPASNEAVGVWRTFQGETRLQILHKSPCACRRAEASKRGLQEDYRTDSTSLSSTRVL